MPNEQTSELMSKPEIKALPEPVQKRLRTFMNSIPKTKWYQPDGKPNPKWHISYGDTWDSAWASAWASARASARDSAWASARDSVWASAWDSAWASAWASARASAWDSARASARDSVWASAWASARDSVWASAWASAWDSAWASARASARDFSLMACMIIVSDLDYPDKEKHEKHVSSRIEVWKKGYGLLYDVRGVLYVYAKK